MKAYKGFNKDMTCRGFQYEEGKTYHVDEAELCKSGFHACENPLDCFSYYAPADSVYHEVELEDVTDEESNDTKVCGKTIKIGAKLDIAGIVKAQIEFVKSKADNGKTRTGDWSAQSSTGYWSAQSSTGYRSAQSSTGDWSAQSSTGNGSAQSSTGDWSAQSSTGYGSAQSSTGYGSVNSTTGCSSNSNARGCSSISIGWGKDNKCKGALGTYIVLVERGKWDGKCYPQIGEPKLGKIDGKTLKADTWYKLENGEFVECGDGEKE